jgi:hypothetical protein
MRGGSSSAVDTSADLVATHAIDLADIQGGTSGIVSYPSVVADTSSLGAVATYDYRQVFAEAALITVEVEDQSSLIYGEASYTQIVAEAEKLDIIFKFAA